MAEDFQALLSRINEQGLKKAEAESVRIIEGAKSEAAKILSAAREEASGIVKEAERSADILQQKGEQSLKQSARSVLLDLRAVLEKRVSDAVVALMRDAMDESGLADIISTLCVGYLKSAGAEENLKILLDASQFSRLEKAVNGKLAADLRNRVELSPSDKVRGGFKLVFKGSDVMYDFTDQALAEAISTHLSANIVAAIAE